MILNLQHFKDRIEMNHIMVAILIVITTKKTKKKIVINNMYTFG